MPPADPTDSAPRRPNVVLVFGDEWRAQATGYAGDPNVRTPRLDRLAGESLNLTEAVAGCPVCCPYRASLMTGQYPLTHGVVINDVPIRPDAPSIPRALGPHGYESAWIGKWHLYGSPEGRNERRRDPVPRAHQLGFDRFMAGECSHDYGNSHYSVNDDPTLRIWEGYDAFAQTDTACDWLKRPERKDRPFFLGLSWGPPHMPLQTAPPEYRQRFWPEDMRLRPNVPEAFAEAAPRDLAGLSAHIAALDDALGRVLDTLEAADLAEDTILIFTSDHGSQHHSQGLNFKLFPFDESVRVPFLLRWPRRFGREARELPVPIDAPDILPTLAGLCGLPPPPQAEGRDWSPVLRGEAEVREDDAALLMVAARFTALRWHDFPEYRGLRTARHTYVASWDGPFLLFDNREDPFQMRNLVEVPDARPARDHLDALLRQRLEALGDPFDTSDIVLRQRGLGHYREANQPVRRPWTDPWLPGAANALRGAWTLDTP